jgi:hypothetical protein
MASCLIETLATLAKRRLAWATQAITALTAGS